MQRCLDVLLIYKRRISGNEIRDMQRGQESGVHILRMLIVTAAPYAAYAFVFHCLPLLDGCFYLNASKESTEAIHLWGNYYGKYMVVIGVFASLVALTTIEPLRKIIGLIDREEYRLAREKAGFLLHQIALLTVPTAVFTAVLAENILNLFFKGNNTKTAEWIMWGSLIIVLYVYALLFMNMLVRLKKMRLVTGCGAVAVLVHVIVTLLLLKNTLLGMTSLVIGNIVFYLLLAAAGAFFVGKSISLSLINVKGIAFTIVSAAIAGLIVMLLNKALVAVLGTTIALVICLPVGVTAYLVLVIVTRAVNERDMQNIRGGGVLLAVARLMHFI